MTDYTSRGVADGTAARASCAVSWSAVLGGAVVSASISPMLLAGRLRTKRVGLHTDEIAFRDTAHGFMTWAVSAIVTALLLAATAPKSQRRMHSPSPK